ncbi:hypothetical protein E2C01_094179 [Portunus trituberculatus]|uniref:Uncharacterized protein n=1 Tax=Portunus trituberculatus TaxID=210409 RepID=A0A5B7K045_PORTR|nr:hypothetical protein [Portunus trituberculatus]
MMDGKMLLLFPRPCSLPSSCLISPFPPAPPRLACHPLTLHECQAAAPHSLVSRRSAQLVPTSDPPASSGHWTDLAHC